MSPGLTALAVLVVAQASPPDLAGLEKRGAIRVIVAADEAPETYSLTETGEPGFERELIAGFARLRNLKVETVVAKTYPERIPLLLAGRGDLIVAIFDTPDRRKQVAFTQEILPTHNVVATLKPRPAVTDVKDLPAERVGAIRGTKPAEAAVEAGVPAASLKTYERLDDLVEALRRAEITAAVLPISELALARRRTPELEAGATVGPAGAVAWAVRKEDTETKRALDEYVANLRRSASWNRLVVKYFGDETLRVLGRAGP